MSKILQCGPQGPCVQDACEKWDTYSKTCAHMAQVFLLRELIGELHLQRRYLRPKTVGELNDGRGRIEEDGAEGPKEKTEKECRAQVVGQLQGLLMATKLLIEK